VEGRRITRETFSFPQAAGLTFLLKPLTRIVIKSDSANGRGGEHGPVFLAVSSREDSVLDVKLVGAESLIEVVEELNQLEERPWYLSAANYGE